LQARQAVADGGAATVANVQRPGGVSGDEFHLHLSASAALITSESIALGENVGYHRALRAAREIEVDKTGPGDFHFGDMARGRQRRDDLLGQLARRQAGGLGQCQGDIGGQIAVGFILGVLHLDRCLGRHSEGAGFV
jgi:hypothetical protein